MINLVYCGNRLMFDGLLLSLLSASKVTSSPLNVYLCTGDFTGIDKTYLPLRESERAYLEMVIQKKNKESKVTLLDLTQLLRDELPAEKNLLSVYTPYALMRLFLDLLPEIPGRILYLDTDTIILKDLEPLFKENLEGKDIGCVLDNLRIIFWKPGYVNSGVLLMDMDLLRHDGMMGYCRERVALKKMKRPDQDAINRIYRKKKKIKVFLRKYNEQRKTFPDTVIRHFTPELKMFPFPHMVNIKSWQIEKVHCVYHLHEFDALYTEMVALKRDYFLSLDK
jgi:lipopolysaccharide biosynthesis glycosyltransferase